MPENTCGKAPRAVQSLDIRALPIGPEEAFVLSCVDGSSSEDDIASATGFDSRRVSCIMNRLAELGAIEFEPLGPAVGTRREEACPASNLSGAFRLGPALEIRESRRSQHPGAADLERSESGEFTVPSNEASSAPPNSAFPDDPMARRRALARKLGHSSAPPTRTPTARPLPDSGRSSAELELKRQQLDTQARQRQLDHYRSLAQKASDEHNLVSAINSLKIACSLAPKDAELTQKLTDMQQRAASEHWEEYAERASYEVFDGRLSDAARSYEFAALGHPCWRFFERAAYCLLSSGGDLRRASDLAKQAVALSPENAKCRLTLAQVYVAAKLKQSALAELERALALDPKQDCIRDYIRSVKRSEI